MWIILILFSFFLSPCLLFIFLANDLRKIIILLMYMIWFDVRYERRAPLHPTIKFSIDLELFKFLGKGVFSFHPWIRYIFFSSFFIPCFIFQLELDIAFFARAYRIIFSSWLFLFIVQHCVSLHSLLVREFYLFLYSSVAEPFSVIHWISVYKQSSWDKTIKNGSNQTKAVLFFSLETNTQWIYATKPELPNSQEKLYTKAREPKIRKSEQNIESTKFMTFYLWFFFLFLFWRPKTLFPAVPNSTAAWRNILQLDIVPLFDEKSTNNKCSVKTNPVEISRCFWLLMQMLYWIVMFVG